MLFIYPVVDNAKGSLPSDKCNKVVDIFHPGGGSVAEIYSIAYGGVFPPIKGVLGMTNLTTGQQI